MDSAKPPTLRSLLTRTVCTLLGLLLLYPLSCGPTGVLVMLTHHGERTWRNFYSPVAFVADYTHTMPLYIGYLDLWKRLAIRLAPQEKVYDPAVE